MIALERECGKWPSGDTYSGILHKDAAAVIGSFHRIRWLAQRYANDLGRRAYYAEISDGGGSAGWAEPEQAKAKPEGAVT
jgi:hypothetical protein